MLKLLVISGLLFGMGNLPWQQNFLGLIAGVIFGTALTIALVPFVSITKYGRQSKVCTRHELYVLGGPVFFVHPYADVYLVGWLP